MCSTVSQLNWERVCNAAKTQDLEFRFLVRLPHASAKDLRDTRFPAERYFIFAHFFGSGMKHYCLRLTSNE
jgi:hypothetical protein